MERKTVLGLAACLAIAGCGTKASDLNPRAQWGTNLSALGIIPLYPPREDVYVGDVFLYVSSPCKGNTLARSSQSIFLGSIPEADIAAAFEQFYSNRPQLVASTKKAASSPGAAVGRQSPSKVDVTATQPITVSVGQTGQAATPATGGSPVGQPTTDDKDPIFRGGRSKRPFNRLPLAAFPDFSYSDFAGAGIGATVPVHVGTVNVGGERQSGRVADVSVGQVEELALPLPVMRRIVLKFFGSPAGQQMLNADDLRFFTVARRNEIIGEQGCFSEDQQQFMPQEIIVVGHAYYARSFNYSFQQTQATAAALSLTLTSLAKGASAAISAAASPAAAASGNAAEDAANGAAAALRSLTSSSSPGVSSSLEIGSQGGLALKQTFDRPLAFGVDPIFSYNAGELVDQIQGNNSTNEARAATYVSNSPVDGLVRLVQNGPNSMVLPRQQSISRPTDGECLNNTSLANCTPISGPQPSKPHSPTVLETPRAAPAYK